jgi:hypothetical protein
MKILDKVLRRGTLSGTVAAERIPPHLKISVEIAFFRLDEPAPRSSSEIRDRVNLKDFNDMRTFPLPFVVRRRAGLYGVVVMLIVVCNSEGKLRAQVEEFHPLTKPCVIVAGEEQRLHLVLEWPQTPVAEQRYYGTFHPDGTFSGPER